MFRFLKINSGVYVFSHHFIQLLNLLEVIIDNAERKSDSADRLDGSASQQQSTPQGLEVENNSENQDTVSGAAGTVTKPIDSSASSSTRAESECDVQSVLLNLPQSELCLLCSLLAREGYVRDLSAISSYFLFFLPFNHSLNLEVSTSFLLFILFIQFVR